MGWHQYVRKVSVVSLVCCAAIASACSQPPVAQQNSRDAPTASPTVSLRRDVSILRMLYSRAPLTLNPHLATGIQDYEAGRIVLEPLATTNDRGDLVPILAAAIPSTENEGIAEDGKSVTWKLRPDVQWSDGTPFTAADVVFTFDFIRNPQVGAATAQYYTSIESVEAVDEHTVEITFQDITAAWQIPFTGQNGVILPQHILEPIAPEQLRISPTNLSPIGTGPYQVTAGQPGVIVYEPNPNYRDEAPFFKGIELVGGIAPYAAAREVLKTGQADFAHNLQVEVDLLKELQTDGKGVVVPVFGGQVERLMLNPTNPFAATPSGERSSLAAPHPFLSDKSVRQAIAYAIDRDALTTELYGFMGRPTGQLLVAPKFYANPGTIPYAYDRDKANALLDEAGWQDSNGDGIRDRDGTEMRVVFQTSVNPVRQKTQTLVKESLAQIGIATDIKRVQAKDFFSADPTQTNSIFHFYADLQAYTTGNDHPDPTIYLNWWTCDQIASQANQWQNPNNARYCNPEYDILWQTSKQELNSEKRAALFQEMDALLSEDVAVIPLVHRAIANGVSKTLTGLEPTPWDTSTWDIHRWRTTAR
ncbi:MAG: peptide ABC transporter substrate-binding protein [Cyanobacteria bacterium J06638_28]